MNKRSIRSRRRTAFCASRREGHRETRRDTERHGGTSHPRARDRIIRARLSHDRRRRSAGRILKGRGAHVRTSGESASEMWKMFRDRTPRRPSYDRAHHRATALLTTKLPATLSNHYGREMRMNMPLRRRDDRVRESRALFARLFALRARSQAICAICVFYSARTVVLSEWDAARITILTAWAP